MNETKAATFRASDNHWVYVFGLFKERVTRDQLRYLLLETPDPIIRGKLCKWRSKDVGAGVYDLWAEPVHPEGAK